jgi:hypothetical protein
MLGIDDIFADDVELKKNGIKVYLKGLGEQFIVVASYDQAKVQDRVERIKHHFYEDKDQPTAEEKQLCFKAAVIETIIKGWNLYEDGHQLEFNDKNLKRIFLDEKYSRLLEVVFDESRSVENYRLKKIADAKKN